MADHRRSDEGRTATDHRPRKPGFPLSRLQKVLLSTLVLIGAFLVGEVLLRIFLPSPQRWRIQPAEVAQADGRRSSVVIPAHPSQGGLFEVRGVHKRLRPNVDAVIARHQLSGQPVRISTNSLGIRHPALGAKRGVRLLFLGDSITFADYLPDELTFVRLIEGLALNDNRVWECVNAGIGAIGLESEVAHYFELERSVDPDTVVLNLFLNDFADSVVWVDSLPDWVHHSYIVTYATTIFMEAKALMTDDTPGTRRLAAWQEEFEGDLQSRGRPPTALEREALTRFREWGGAWSRHTWDSMRPAIEQLADDTRKSGRRLFLVLHPIRAQVDSAELDDAPQQFFLALAADLDLPALDLLPALRAARDANRQPLFFDHCHHTQWGAEVVADEMYAFLTRH